MAPFVICYIFLQVFLLVSTNDLLTIYPKNPIVPLGGSIKLNCSINNPSCSTNWKGLDTNLGSVYTAPGSSVLTIENASIAMEGTKICVKTCPDRHKNLATNVVLHIYALPETLHLSINITNGIPFLHCLIKGIYPINSIKVQCYRGSEKLNELSEDFTLIEEIGIYHVIRSFEISNEDLNSQTLYNCEAELSVGEQTFRMLGMLDIPKEVTTDILARTVTDADNYNTTMTTRTPKASSTDMDSTTLYKRTPIKSTLSPPSTVFSSVSTHKQLPTSDTVLTTDALTTTMSDTEKQNSNMRTPKTFSTTVNTGTPIERTQSPLSMMVSSLSTNKKLSTADTLQTINPLAVTVTDTTNQNTVMTTRTLTTQMTLSSQAASTAFSSFTTHKVLLNSETDYINVMWMAVPAVSLAGSILIFLKIWRQLNKKGFFQPNQSHWPESKEAQKILCAA